MRAFQEALPLLDPHAEVSPEPCPATCPSLTDNETDPVSVGQGRALCDRLTCPKTFRLFTRAEGAEGHCEGMAPAVFWTAALDWLDDLLA